MHSFVASALVLALASLAQAQTAGFDPVLNPATGEQLIIGTTYTITWDVTPATYASQNVSLTLIGGATKVTQETVYTIASSVLNSAGQFDWAIPTTESGQPFYGIVIALVSNPSVLQYSVPFLLVDSNSTSVPSVPAVPAGPSGSLGADSPTPSSWSTQQSSWSTQQSSWSTQQSSWSTQKSSWPAQTPEFSSQQSAKPSQSFNNLPASKTPQYTASSSWSPAASWTSSDLNDSTFPWPTASPDGPAPPITSDPSSFSQMMPIPTFSQSANITTYSATPRHKPSASATQSGLPRANSVARITGSSFALLGLVAGVFMAL